MEKNQFYPARKKSVPRERYYRLASRYLFSFLSVLAFMLCLQSVALAYDKFEAIQNGLVVKYVNEDIVYLRGGSGFGLAVGQQLEVKRSNYESGENSEAASDEAKGFSISETIATIKIVSVANISAVCEIVSSSADIQAGDIAYLLEADIEKMLSDRTSSEFRKYPQVITFTEDDPLEEELRASMLTRKLPEVNRMRGRLGVEYNTIMDPAGEGMTSRQLGMIARMDFTRLGGTYWDFKGYYRGRLNSRTSGSDQETLTDLINRTYHLSMNYNNPRSNWVAGGGRLYLPWATSLGTIDGGYFGRKIGSVFTFGAFGGSSPDPASWNYDRDRQLGGVFANFNIGSFESVRLTSTSGVAVSGIDWKSDREYGFFENSFFYKRYLSVFHNMEADFLRDPAAEKSRKLTLSRSYLTVRFQPIQYVSFNFSHNYFRNIPTFDPRLISTGLVDELLFEGFNGGIRFDLPYKIRLYSNLGRSEKTGDTNPAMNRTYGIAMGNIWPTGISADFRYSSFDSAFGRGLYRSLSVSREISNFLRFDLRAGQQDFSSELVARSRSRWLSLDSEYYLGRHYIVGAGFTVYRGQSQEYDQWYVNLGYRF